MYLVGTPEDRFFREEAQISQHESLDTETGRYEPRHNKTVFGVSDRAQHKTDCTVTKNGWIFGNLNLGSRWIVISMFQKFVS